MEAFAHTDLRAVIDSLNGHPFDSSANFSGITSFNDPWLASVNPTVTLSNDTLRVSIPNDLDAGQLNFIAVFDSKLHSIKSLSYDGSTTQGFGMGVGSKSWHLHMHDLPYSIDAAGNLISDMGGVDVLQSMDTFAMTERVYQGQNPRIADMTYQTNYGYPIDSNGSLRFSFEIGDSKPALVRARGVSAGLECYPNPATSTLSVYCPTEESQLITVVDMLGRTRVTQRLHRGSASLNLDVRSLENGTYVLMTKSGRATCVFSR